MKRVRGESKLLAAMFFGFILLLALPAVSVAQGRGRGRGRGPDWDKKCAKFVNCHDARDGRWDGRGPRRNAYDRRYSIFGNRVGYRNRSYRTNDYWRRRHFTYRRDSDMNWRSRSYRRRY
jgi:hypothetical protein